jgi:potassium efflux system protein
VLVVRRLSTLFVWVGVAVWAKGTLDDLTLSDVFMKASKGILGTALEVGALHISLGDILALVVGTVLAVQVARVLRFVLDQDVLGRLSMSAGNREVAGSGIYWAALIMGFFAALAAAGIGLERLTVLAGAIGVGVGFGLQNVVQNFVGGLILLFGRFIKVGDKIQLADLMGEVRSIGFRASTVRTWQGAEVIVPNSKLISDQVINWTLSDQKRRIELEVGVAYGTDPERVIALLREVGQSNAKVLADPPVVVFFTKHGDSALVFELRAWVTFDDFAPVSSELTVAMNKRLVAEGIEIPFPQRDLNLRTIAPEVAEALGPRANPPRQ